MFKGPNSSQFMKDRWTSQAGPLKDLFIRWSAPSSPGSSESIHLGSIPVDSYRLLAQDCLCPESVVDYRDGPDQEVIDKCLNLSSRAVTSLEFVA